MGLAIPVGWRFLRSFTIILERTFSFSFHRFLLVWVILHSLPFKRMYCSSSMLSLTSCPESFYELWHQKIWQFSFKGHISYVSDKICISRCSMNMKFCNRIYYLEIIVNPYPLEIIIRYSKAWSVWFNNFIFIIQILCYIILMIILRWTELFLIM